MSLVSIMWTLRKKMDLRLVGIILITFLLYSKALFLEFWYMDDHWMIYGNSAVIDLNPKSLYDLFFSTYYYQHSPINTLYYRTVYLIAGMDPFAFHIASIVIHLLNIYLVYVFTKKILKKTSSDKPVTYIQDVALLISLLFAIHPINVESVVWLSASKIILYSFFHLLGMLLYIKYIENQRWQILILIYFIFVLSVFSKEQAVIFPVNLILIDLLHRRKFTLKMILEKVAFFFTSTLYGLLTLENSGIPLSPNYDVIKQFAIASFNLVSYLINLISPFWLKNLYPIPNYIDIQLPNGYYVCAVSVILAIAYMSIHLIYRKWILDTTAFGFAFFLINLILSTHLIPMNRPMIIADRYVYLSSIGFFIIMIPFFYEKIALIKLRSFRVVSMALLISYSVVCTKLTLDHIGNYKTNRKENEPQQSLIN